MTSQAKEVERAIEAIIIDNLIMRGYTTGGEAYYSLRRNTRRIAEEICHLVEVQRVEITKEIVLELKSVLGLPDVEFHVKRLVNRLLELEKDTKWEVIK